MHTCLKYFGVKAKCHLDLTVFIGRLILETFAAFILIILPSAITIVWKNLHHSICRFICYRDKPSMIDKKFVTDSPPSLLCLWKMFSFLTSVDYSGVSHDIEQFVSRQTGEQICHLVIGPSTTSSQTLSSNQCSFMVTNWREVNIISAIADLHQSWICCGKYMLPLFPIWTGIWVLSLTVLVALNPHKPQENLTIIKFLKIKGINLKKKFFRKNCPKQECIPIGCVPPAHWPYLPACSASGGVPGPGVYLVLGRCVCSRSGGCLLQVRGGQVLPPVNRMTDACKNITLPQLRCGR